MDGENTLLQKRAMLEIQNIDKKINELKRDRATFERQLIRLRQEDAGVVDGNRKNSVDRIMIENKVLAELQRNKLSTRALFNHVKTVSYELKESTFRTQLHRMKNKGLIENAGSHGRWKLSAQKSN